MLSLPLILCASLSLPTAVASTTATHESAVMDVKAAGLELDGVGPLATNCCNQAGQCGEAKAILCKVCPNDNVARAHDLVMKAVQEDKPGCATTAKYLDAFQTSTGADWNGSIGGICECFSNFTEEEAATLNCWIGRFNVQETHAQCKVCTEVFDDLSTVQCFKDKFGRGLGEEL